MGMVGWLLVESLVLAKVSEAFPGEPQDSLPGVCRRHCFHPSLGFPASASAGVPRQLLVQIGRLEAAAACRWLVRVALEPSCSLVLKNVN